MRKNEKCLLYVSLLCLTLNLFGSQAVGNDRLSPVNNGNERGKNKIASYNDVKVVPPINRLKIPKETQDALDNVLKNKKAKQATLAELTKKLNLLRYRGCIYPAMRNKQWEQRKKLISTALEKDKLHPDWIVYENKQDDEKKAVTPLIDAVAFYDNDFAQYLLERGTNPKDLDQDDEWQCRIANSWMSVVRPRGDNIFDVTVMWALAGISPNMAQLLLKHGAAPSLRKYNDTLLTYVTDHVSRFEYIPLFMEHGANPNVHLRHGIIPLARLPTTLVDCLRRMDNNRGNQEKLNAVEKTKAAVISLIRGGARLDLKNRNGSTFPQLLRRMTINSKTNNERFSLGVLRDAAKEEWNKKRLTQTSAKVAIADYETLENEPAEND